MTPNLRRWQRRPWPVSQTPPLHLFPPFLRQVCRLRPIRLKGGPNDLLLRQCRRECPRNSPPWCQDHLCAEESPCLVSKTSRCRIANLCDAGVFDTSTPVLGVCQRGVRGEHGLYEAVTTYFSSTSPRSPRTYHRWEELIVMIGS